MSIIINLKMIKCRREDCIKLHETITAFIQWTLEFGMQKSFENQFSICIEGCAFTCA